MIPPRTPVLAGVGVATQREDDPRAAAEPLDLMIEAARRAVADAGGSSLAARIARVAVPKGRWSYADPGHAVAEALGCPGATSVLSTVGVLQQSLIGEACRLVADGEIEAALVVGGDAGYRILRAGIMGVEAAERETPGAPDAVLSPREELRHEAEKRAGLKMPVGLYAMLESAFRAKRGWSVAEHRDRIARLYARFTEIAAGNPDAWTRKALPAEAIREPSERNPMQAFPYTRLHCASWNVDQAAALLIVSAGLADEAGVPRDRWVFPQASAESNHMLAVCQRAELDRSPGARIAGEAALAHAGVGATEVDLVELYSCFPVAVEQFAAELGLDMSRDLTVTGGMPFAGGPYNNYVFQATARMATLLREGRGRTGLVGSVSGINTKQGFGLWSTAPAPAGFRFADVTGDVARAAEAKPVEMNHAGPARIVGCTVVHAKGQPPRAVAVAETVRGTRVVVASAEAAAVARIEREECVGAPILAEAERFAFADEAPKAAAHG